MDILMLAAAGPAALGPGEADYSFIGLFFRADIIVKAVMIGLALASIWSWAIILDKQFQLMGLRRKARRFEDDFWAGRSLDDLDNTFAAKPRDPMSRVFAAAMSEWRESKDSTSEGQMLSLRERIDRVMNVAVQREISNLESGLGALASIGSVSVFVGLLGTVWGIMNSFRAIAASRDTNLAVVAPGIAEALFATALGLVAAIPAVIFYNKFSTDISRYAVRLEGYADELSAILSRRIHGRR
ncbi:MAG: protein TolQ [Euryhalocaulis sp.]|uniref:protein TolQ n=1 Tax=Euryhalocaulis sp. TaxID=2744307 RepID=UPI0017912DF8|nr:protein TolQ [Euryhalocaulis sp.]MBA4800678.1 protein TolQ [Euryhalocaulis sp.]